MIGNRTSFGSMLDELRRLDPDWDDLFAGSPLSSGVRSVRQGSFPPLNVGSSEDSVDVYLFAAGLDPESLNVTLQQNLLTLSGSRAQNHGADEDPRYYRRERFAGSFQRVLTLPEHIDPEQVDATYRDGVLHVRVARREDVKPRRIDVH